MSLDSDIIVDRRRIRRKLTFWRVMAALIAIAAWTIFGRKPAAPAPGAGAAEQLPSVTVIVPGRSTVDRTINATGTIAARVDMPVGVAGEGESKLV